MVQNNQPISDAERDVLQVLWEHGPQQVRAVHEKLSTQGFDWQRSTVITLLQRLEKKGYVSSDRSGHAFIFKAEVSRNELVHQRMIELADEWCDGQTTPLLLAFAEKQKFSSAEIAELRKMVDELANKQIKKKKGQ